MTTLSPNQPAVESSRGATAIGTRNLVTVNAGGHEFAIETEHINGVYQLDRSKLGGELTEVNTPEGTLPVISLAQLFSQEFGMSVEGSETERALVVIHYLGQTAVIRVGSVSRPIELEPDSFFGLPRVAHANDPNNMISKIAVLDWELEDSSESLRLVVDPLAVLGLRDKPAFLLPESTAQDSVSRSENTDHGQGQILAFSPENVSRSDLDFVFCLPLSGVAEVVSVSQAMNMPFKSPSFQGFIVWRNQPVPIISLGEAFGQHTISGTNQRKRSRARRLIVARASGGRYVGFYTQKQMHSMKTPTASPVTFESLQNAPYFGAFKTEFGAMVVPDLSRILDCS